MCVQGFRWAFAAPKLRLVSQELKRGLSHLSTLMPQASTEAWRHFPELSASMKMRTLKVEVWP